LEEGLEIPTFRDRAPAVSPRLVSLAAHGVPRGLCGPGDHCLLGMKGFSFFLFSVSCFLEKINTTEFFAFFLYKANPPASSFLFNVSLRLRLCDTPFLAVRPTFILPFSFLFLQSVGVWTPLDQQTLISSPSLFAGILTVWFSFSFSFPFPPPPRNESMFPSFMAAFKAHFLGTRFLLRPLTLNLFFLLLGGVSPSLLVFFQRRCAFRSPLANSERHKFAFRFHWVKLFFFPVCLF